MTTDPARGQPVRPASTVMLVRDGRPGLEVFTLRRVAGMAFAGGMTAFPGGGVDPSDTDPDIPWAGPDARWWADQWRIGPDEARSQVVAAVRELFEETGILLAGSADDPGDVAAGDPVEREAGRLAVAEHRRSMADALRVLDSTCAPTCCDRGPGGSPRPARPADTTRTSSLRPCPRVSAPRR